MTEKYINRREKIVIEDYNDNKCSGACPGLLETTRSHNQHFSGFRCDFFETKLYSENDDIFRCDECKNSEVADD